MKIIVNNEIKEVAAGVSIESLLQTLALKEQRVAVLKNGELIVRSLHQSVLLEEDDTIDIVHAIGGG